MDVKAGPPGAWIASTTGQRAPGGAPHAHLRNELSPEFWGDAPALSWLLDPASGDLQFRGVLPGSEPGPSASVHQEVLAGALAGKLKDGPRPVRMLEVLPGTDGQPHHFLILGFPLAGVDGVVRPYLAGVAIDITRHKRRVDELAQQALVDELTGLYNLRGFFLFAEHELKVARRRGTHSAILYIDVDGLKKINDRDGHERGSAVLVETADVLRQVFRECDVIARLGGDEFAVFAAEINGDPEQMRKRLFEAVGRSGASWSVSSGVGARPPDPALRLADLLTAADQAMYRDKFEKLEADRAP